MKSIISFARQSLIATIFICFIFSAQGQSMFNALDSKTENTFIASSFINDSEGWLADANAILWHTKDGGISLDTVYSGKTFYRLDFADGLNGFALSEQEAFKTSDGGSSWESVSLYNVSPALYFLNKDTGIISGNNIIYRTTDGGKSWSSIEIAVPFFSDYFFIDQSTGVATCSNDQEYRSIWRTTDGGLSWKNVCNVSKYFMYAVWFVNDQVGFAAGYFEEMSLGNLPSIMKTSDGGITWENIYKNEGIISFGEPLIDIRFQDEENGFAIGEDGESVFTTDGGLTWTSARESNTTGLPMGCGIFKTLDGYNDLYITGKDGYVIKW
ncbi:MAG: hypothetical protein LH473_06745 [Chitinophagales bacterium]|nr:hypothetical protein [Chitinophagales bacterium]